MASYEDPQITLLNEKLRNYERYARKIEKEKFDLEHRVQNIIHGFGFDTLRDAEESQQSLRPGSGGPVASTSRAPALPTTSSSDSDSGAHVNAADSEVHLHRISELEEEIARLRFQLDFQTSACSSLESKLDISRAETASLSDSLAALQTESNRLEKSNKSFVKQNEDLVVRLMNQEQYHKAAIDKLKSRVSRAETLVPSTAKKENRKLVDVSISTSPRKNTPSASPIELVSAHADLAALQVQYKEAQEGQQYLANKLVARKDEWKSFKDWLVTLAERKRVEEEDELAKKASGSSASTTRKRKKDRGKAISTTNQGNLYGRMEEITADQARDAAEKATKVLEEVQHDLDLLPPALLSKKPIEPALPSSSRPTAPLSPSPTNTPTRKRKLDALVEPASPSKRSPRFRSHSPATTHLRTEPKPESPSTPPRSTQELLNDDTVIAPPSAQRIRIIPLPPLFSSSPRTTVRTSTPKRVEPRILVPGTSPDAVPGGGTLASTPQTSGTGPATMRKRPGGTGGVGLADGFTARLVSLSTPKARPSSTKKEAERSPDSNLPSNKTSIAIKREPSLQEKKRVPVPSTPVIDLTIDSQGSETQPMSDAIPSSPAPAHEVDRDGARKESRAPSSPYKSALTDPSSEGGDVELEGERTSSPDPKVKDLAAATKKDTAAREPIRTDGSSSIVLLEGLDGPVIFPPPSLRRIDPQYDIDRTPIPRSKALERLRDRLDPEHSPPVPSSAGASGGSSRLTLSTPKVRSELPRDMRKPRAIGEGSMTDPRPSSRASGFVSGFPGAIANGSVVKKSRPRISNMALLGLSSEPEGDTTIKAHEQGQRDIKTSQRLLKYTSSPHILQSSSSPAASPRKPKPPPSFTALAQARTRASLATPGAGPSSSSSSKGKERQEAPAPATASRLELSTMTRLQREQHLAELKKHPASSSKAYGAFKGRGRYAQAGDEDDWNARYEIDKTRNGGMDQPFEEVVRGKEARKRLHAADCECCKDYYEAVGPLPDRLKAPMWKTPSPQSSQASSSQVTAAGGTGGGSKKRRHRSASPASPSRHQRQKKREIEEHRQQISRHRHHWAPTNTPPDYWTIAFPDTQQVQDINRRADEMHQAKRRKIEEEARDPDGRYRKKR